MREAAWCRRSALAAAVVGDGGARSAPRESRRRRRGTMMTQQSSRLWDFDAAKNTKKVTNATTMMAIFLCPRARRESVGRSRSRDKRKEKRVAVSARRDDDRLRAIVRARSSSSSWSSSSQSSLGDDDDEEEEEKATTKKKKKKKNDIGIEFEQTSSDENFVGLTKPIAFALFKHKTQAVITLGLVLLFSTANRTIFTLTALPIANELQLSITQIGWIQNLFLVGYMCTNVIGGQLATNSKSRIITPTNLMFLVFLKKGKNQSYEQFLIESFKDYRIHCLWVSLK